jgi:hypothetical protein
MNKIKQYFMNLFGGKKGDVLMGEREAQRSREGGREGGRRTRRGEGGGREGGREKEEEGHPQAFGKSI